MKKLCFFLSNNSESMKICIDYIQQYLKDIVISLIIFDKESSNIYKKLKNYNIPKKVYSNWKNRNITCDEICDLCEQYKIDYLFLGFNKLLSGKILTIYKNKIINTHPALLPSFKGINAIERAFDSEVRYIGMTTHFIDEYMDEGIILLQGVIKITNQNIEIQKQNYFSILVLIIISTVILITNDEIEIHQKKIKFNNVNYNNKYINPAPNSCEIIINNLKKLNKNLIY